MMHTGNIWLYIMAQYFQIMSFSDSLIFWIIFIVNYSILDTKVCMHFFWYCFEHGKSSLSLVMTDFHTDNWALIFRTLVIYLYFVNCYDSFQKVCISFSILKEIINWCHPKCLLLWVKCHGTNLTVAHPQIFHKNGLICANENILIITKLSDCQSSFCHHQISYLLNWLKSSLDTYHCQLFFLPWNANVSERLCYSSLHHIH